MPMTPEEFGAYIRNDIAKWSQLAKTRILEIDNPPFRNQPIARNTTVRPGASSPQIGDR